MAATRGPVGRNAPCPCGSGRKFKQCCGRRAAPARAASAPLDAASILRQAQAERASGRLPNAAELYQRLLAADSGHPEALLGLGEIAGRSGDVAAALDLLDRAARAAPHRALPRVHRAAVLQQARRLDEALAEARRAVAIEPGSAEAHGLVASCLERMNRHEEAEAALHACLAVAPGDLKATTMLARSRRRGGDAAGARQLLDAALADPAASAWYRPRAERELGFALEALGEAEAAFEAAARAGRAEATGPDARRVDGEAVFRRIERYRRALDPASTRRFDCATIGDELEPPVFLVGFLRTGTTMTEQILAAHPRIVTSGEDPVLRPVKLELARRAAAAARDDEPAQLAALGIEDVRALRRVFLAESERLAGGPLRGRVFIDKQPMNLVELGLIATLFPEARVIFTQRDPRDACLSCFQQWFRPNHLTVNFLDWSRTAQLYAATMDLWAHWSETLALPIAEARYETTVGDLEGTARRLLAHVGLDWDPALLRFHERARERVISTPSADAVTRPVHRGAVARWRRFAPRFAAVRDELAPWVERFGYGPWGPAA